MLFRTGFVLVALFVGATLSATGAEWPQFRGPDGQGNVTGSAPLNWSEQQGVRWKTAVPGRGWSSPVVEGNQIWMTTAIETPGDPNTIERKGGPPPSQLSLADSLSLRAICVDRESGKVIQNTELIVIGKPNQIHSLNSYASPSPVIEDGKLYCHFGRYGTFCLDTATGELDWERQFEIEHYVGPGSSLALCDDLVIVTCDGADKQYVVAVNKKDGSTAWKKDRPPLRATNPDFKKSYCTPLVVMEDGKKQIVIPGAQWLIAYAPEDGREIWRMDHGSGFSVVPRPVVDDAHIYFSTGFGGAKLMAVPRGGANKPAWQFNKQVPTQSSPVLHSGRIFLVSDSGIGQCIDTATQEVLWKKRMPGNYSASILRVEDRLYYFNRDGVTTVIDATTPKGSVIATNKLEGQLMATPALVDGELIVRSDTHLYAIGE